MSIKIFTSEDIDILSKNKYVKNVSDKAITYNDEFKEFFISENKAGKFSRQIFEECGFDVDILEMERGHICLLLRILQQMKY